MTYTFGDAALASERLRIVATTMERPARAVLARVETRPVTRVVDLGCGPGHTTRLLADVFGAASVTGIDASAAYVAEATANAGPRCTFVLADVGVEPLPGAPADVVYARYLLSHLSGIADYVDRWCRALVPGGSLVLEEPESIQSSDPDFSRYEQIARALVQAAGGVFYAGPHIAAMAAPAGRERIYDQAMHVDVTAGQAAAMFWRNARSWDPDALSRAQVDVAEVRALADRLQRREGDQTRGLFDWRQRQAVFTRSSTAC